MDLPTCPTCGQSVLDDDATECPFCGSSMSASKTASAPTNLKSKSAPPSAKASPVTPNSVEGSPAKGAKAKVEEAMPAEQLARRRRPGEEVEVAYEEMVTADQEALKRAYPVRQKPAKGYNYKVVCPMCEAPGYVPPKAAGHEAKCYNPHCMVPIFKAPAIEKKEKEPEPSSEGLSPMVYGGISVVVLALAVGGYYLFSRGSSNNDADQPIVSTPQSGDPDETELETDPNKKAAAQADEDQGPTLAEIRRESFTEIKRAAQRVPRNRKAIARRWCAEAAISMGNLEEAENQLQQLDAVGETVPFLKIPPLVELGWAERAAGHSAEVANFMKEANKYAPTLRAQGRFRYDAAMSLAGLLAANGAFNEAVALVAEEGDSSLQAQLAADIFISQHAVNFDFNTARSSSPIGGWHAPLISGVTADLVAHGEIETALRWAKQSDDPESRTEAVMVWSEYLVRQKGTANLQEQVDLIHKEIQSLDASGQAMVLSRISSLATERKQNEIAEKLAGEASALLEPMKNPAALEFANIKSVIEYDFPNPVDLRITARAFAASARAQINLDKTKPGLEDLGRGLDFCRAYAPAFGTIRKRMDEIKYTNYSELRELIRRELRLQSDADAREQLAIYRRNCERLEEMSKAQFALQTDMIAAALSAKTVDAIAERIKTSAGPESPDPFLTTKLPVLVTGEYFALGDDAKAQEMMDRLEKSSPTPEHYRHEARRLITQNKPKEAAKILNKMKFGETVQDIVVFGLVSEFVHQDQWRPALIMCGYLEQDSLAEEAIFLGSAQASQRGSTKGVFAYVENTKPKHIERISIYSGIVLGSSLFLKERPKDTKNQ